MMGSFEWLIIAMVCVSLFIFCSVLILFTDKLLNHPLKRVKHIEVGKMALFVCLLVSIWILRGSIGLYASRYFAREFFEQSNLTPGEMVFDSFIHSMQTFSMDEDYTKYLSFGKQMIVHMGGGQTLVNAFGIYIAVSNVSAPIAGSAIVLQFVTNFFPGLRFKAVRRFSNKQKYIFSELNEKSLIVAQSILKDNTARGVKSDIIFTDVYVDEEDEEESELLIEAKKIGAICLKDDILHLNFAAMNRKIFFLIDDKEQNNIQLLSKLGSSEFFSQLSHQARVLVYYDDEAYAQIQKSVYTNMMKLVDGDSDKMPVVLKMNCYRNLVWDCLRTYPLFNNSKTMAQDDLKLAIIGGGKIGLQMLLNAYWCGQIYDTPLHINVCTMENKEDFVGRVDAVNPEIIQTAYADSPLLKLYADKADDAQSPPYFNFGYLSKHLDECGIDGLCFDNGDKLTACDYYLVCLGSDTQNIFYANMLYRLISMRKAFEKDERPVTILYVVYDADIAGVLNENYSGAQAITIQAIGNIEQVYNIDNIAEEKYMEMSRFHQEGYDRIHHHLQQKLLNLQADYYSDKEEALKQRYGIVSNICRSIFLPYSVYSTLKMHGVTDVEIMQNGKLQVPALKKYFELIEDEKTDKALIWLEHRRWTSNLRARGYRVSPADVQKSFKLKYHPCLVECVDESKTEYDKNQKTDMLDVVGDYKTYDSPKAVYQSKQAEIIDYFSAEG